jgi:hypothetical protein
MTFVVFDQELKLSVQKLKSNKQSCKNQNYGNPSKTAEEYHAEFKQQHADK